MSLRLKFNLSLLLVMLLGLGLERVSVAPPAAEERARRGAARGGPDDGVGARHPRLHGRPRPPAPRETAGGRVHPADRARLRRHRDAHDAAQEVPRVRATRKRRSTRPTRATWPRSWEAKIVEAFRTDGRLTGSPRRARDPLGPSLYVARPIQIRQRGLPGLPQRARRRRPPSMIKHLRRPVRLRLEAERDHRRAGRLGADGGADRSAPA